MTVDCYSLRYVKVGTEEIGARPIAWDTEDVDGFGTNAEGETVHATKWMATCPHCANLMEFSIDQIKRIDDDGRVTDYTSCSECGAGADRLEGLQVVPTEDALDESGLMDIDQAVLDIDVAEFVDPLKDLGFEIDYERLPGAI